MNTNRGFTVVEITVAGLLLTIIGGMLWVTIGSGRKDTPITPTVTELLVSPPVTTPAATTTPPDATTTAAPIRVVNDPSPAPTREVPLTTIDVFFHDDNKFHTPNVYDYTTAVKRSTTRTDIGTFAIEQLIEGPTQEERDAGLISFFGNSDLVKFTSESNCSGNDFTLSISDKIATVTFCREIQFGGDLTAMMIRHQIYNTLTQFSTVDKVRMLDYKGECFDGMSGTSGEDCIYPQPEVDRVIASASISDHCTVDIQTNKIAHIIDMDAQTNYPEEDCKDFKTLEISADGQNLAYVDVSGGIDSMLSLYSIKHDAHYTLDILGTSTIRDMVFLPDGRLAVINGYEDSYNEQWVTVYDVPAFVAHDTLSTDRAVSMQLVEKKQIDTPPIEANFEAIDSDNNLLYVFGKDNKTVLFTIPLNSF